MESRDWRKSRDPVRDHGIRKSRDFENPSHGLLESLFSQLQNALSFESEAAKVKRSWERKSTCFFKAAILSKKKDKYKNNFYTTVLKMF